MNELLAMIEALIRGEYDLHGEKIIAVSCDIARAADNAHDELYAKDYDFAETLIEGLYDLAEEYDDGTPEEGAEYVRRVKELYEKAKAMVCA